MFKKLLTPLIACSVLAIALMGTAQTAHAQAPQLVDCIVTSSTPCNTIAPEGNGTQGDKLWIAAGKFNNDFQFLAPLWALPANSLFGNPTGAADNIGPVTVGTGLQLVAGVLSSTGGGGGGAFQTNGIPLSSTTTINYLNSVTSNGVTITFINPSAGNVQLALSFPAGQIADEFLASPCGSTGALTLRTLCSADLPNTIAANTTGNSATATQLAGTPTVCTGGQVPTGVISNGNATGCFTPGASGISVATNNTANSSQSALNFENGATANGITAVVTNPSAGNVQLGLSFPTGQTADEFLASPCGSTGALGLRVLCSADFPGTIGANTTGNSATATQLAEAPTVCTGGQVPTGISANGNATGCFTPSGAGVTLDTNNVANSSQIALNFENGTAANGITAVVTNPSAGNVQLGLSFPTGQTADEFLASPCGSTGALGLRILCSADLPATIGASTTGNAATATQLAAAPSQCTGSQFAVGVTATGAANCATPAGGGNMSASGSPVQFQLGVWVNGTLLAGIGPGTAGQALVSGGASANPSYSSSLPDVTSVNNTTIPAAQTLVYQGSAAGTPASISLLNAINLPLSTGVTGTLQAANFPAQTGDMTNSAGSLANTVSRINGGNVPTSAALMGTDSSARPAAVTVGTGLTFGGGTLSATSAGNPQTGTSYTVLASDCGKTLTFNNASAVAVTLPAATTTGFGSGCGLTVQNYGAGTLTLTTTSTINGGTSSTTIVAKQNEGFDIGSFDGSTYSAASATALTPAVNLAGTGHGGIAGTLPGANMTAVNLASTSNGGVSGTLPTTSGGTGNTALTFPTGTATVPAIGAAQTWVGEQSFSAVQGATNLQSGTTYTLASTDCGKTLPFSSSSAVTVTVAASIVPASGTSCIITIVQAGTAKISVNGSAVTAATLESASSYTGTSGTQWSVITLTLTTISSTAYAILTGQGS